MLISCSCTDCEVGKFQQNPGQDRLGLSACECLCEAAESFAGVNPVPKAPLRRHRDNPIAHSVLWAESPRRYSMENYDILDVRGRVKPSASSVHLGFPTKFPTKPSVWSVLYWTASCLPSNQECEAGYFAAGNGTVGQVAQLINSSLPATVDNVQNLGQCVVWAPSLV